MLRAEKEETREVPFALLLNRRFAMRNRSAIQVNEEIPAICMINILKEENNLINLFFRLETLKLAIFICAIPHSARTTKAERNTFDAYSETARVKLKLRGTLKHGFIGLNSGEKVPSKIRKSKPDQTILSTITRRRNKNNTGHFSR